ncbi:extracellular solute-binding protein [Microbacterium sp.]|uniref:extracellular solute-binding protein n=1 Tax=Microbacterium sp. TaxID=51671 RepID=UPI0028123C13|nr:extracellular solute-binding protein [Microbacterium sp.]
MKTKLLAASAIAIAATLALSGCGRADSAAEAPDKTSVLSDGPATGTVKMWAMGTEGELLPDFVKAFEEANPEVAVEVTAIPWDSALQKFQTAIASGNVPDVAMMPGLPIFKNAYAPVPDGIDVSGMFEGSVATGNMDGAQLQVPWYVDTRVLYYRTDLAEQAGWTSAPSTWDELHQFAGDMQKKAGAEWGIRLPAGGPGSFQNTLWMPWSAGGELMDDGQDEWSLDTSEFAAAYEYLKSFFTDGIANPNADPAPAAAVNDFISGANPALITGPFFAGLLNGAAKDLPYATTVLPADESSTSFVGGANLVVFKEAANSDAGWKLVRWLSEPETQVAWYEASGDLPAVQSAWEDPVLKDDDTLAAFGEQLQTAKSPPQIVSFDKVGDEGDAVIEQIIRGTVTVEDGLASLQKRADEIGTE